VQNVRHHNSTVHHEWLTVKSLTLGQELVLQKIQQIWFEQLLTLYVGRKEESVDQERVACQRAKCQASQFHGPP
jgi:hypothetical protein